MTLARLPEGEGEGETGTLFVSCFPSSQVTEKVTTSRGR